MNDQVQYPASSAAIFPADDPRQEQWANERRERGFDKMRPSHDNAFRDHILNMWD